MDILFGRVGVQYLDAVKLALICREMCLCCSLDPVW